MESMVEKLAIHKEVFDLNMNDASMSSEEIKYYELLRERVESIEKIQEEIIYMLVKLENEEDRITCD